jgi:4-hydroxy-tetrahydrodipicolinate synthase
LFAWHADRHPDFGIAQIRAVAESFGDLPIVLFQYSPNNPYYYKPEVLARICEEIPQVQAIKMATNVDVAQYEEEVRAVRSVGRKVYLLPANGRTFYYAFQLQPDGALSGSANFAPEHDVELFEAVTRGDFKQARALHDQIFPIFRRVYRDPYVYLHIRYKACTWLLGKISSPAVRSPLVPLPEEELKALREGLGASGLEPVG